MVEFTSYLVRIGWMSNMGLISWCRDVWYRYFHGMTYDECVECEEPKTYVDVNGNEYDASKHDFMKDWIVREREVESKLREGARRNKAAFGDKLRKISRESQKEKADDFNKMMDKAREEAERLFDILKKEIVKYAKNGNTTYGISYAELNEIIEENDIGVNNPVYLRKFFREICERNKMNVIVLDYYDGGGAYVFTWGK